MATENLKSTAVTNGDATPTDQTGAYLARGRLREDVGIVEGAGGDAASTYRFVRLPSSARVSEVWFACDDLGVGVTLDIGLYRTAADGGAVVDADLFASAIDVATAAVAWTQIINESGVVNIDDSEKRLWEMLGLTADPQIMYDVVGTSGVAAATGTMALRVRYVDGT